MKTWLGCIAATVRRGIWLPLGVFLLHEACAHACGNLYDLWPPLDIPMHFLGGVAIAHFGAEFFRQSAERGLIRIGSDLMATGLVLALTMSAATVWEYAEWVSDHTLGTQAQKGLDDTLFDTLVGFLGGSLFVLASRGRRIVRELSQSTDEEAASTPAPGAASDAVSSVNAEPETE